MVSKFSRRRFSLSGILLVLLVTLSKVSLADNNSRSGFIDFNIYPYLSDVDNDNWLTVNLFSTLPNRFSYFSLTNFSSQQGQRGIGDLNNFYTEQNIRWQIAEGSPIDLTLQMNFRSGEDNDRHRLGFRWRLNNTQQLRNAFKKLNLSYSINFHLLQIDNESADVYQLEHVFNLKMPYISDRIYLAGFIDHTFNQNLSTDLTSNPMVGEVQFGYEIVDHLYAIAEYRVNQYRRSDVNNFAIGIEYKIVW